MLHISAGLDHLLFLFVLLLCPPRCWPQDTAGAAIVG